MQKRQSHNKSRRGCLNCKKRHVKCDEQGPPCAGCIIRKKYCVYPTPPDSGASHNKISSLTRRPKDASESDPRERSPCPSSVVISRPSIVSSPVSSLNPSPAAFSSTPESHRLLELELMHRWTTRTWMGFCSIPEDQEYLQNFIPHAALRTSYLMNGILAIAAVDLARTGESNPAPYLLAALEYSNKASADFRTQLCDINQDNLHLLYYFGILAAVFNFAVPFEQLSTIDRMKMGFDMLLGATNIALTNMQWLFEKNPSLTVVTSYERATMDILDHDTRIALDRLTTVSRGLGIPALNEEIQIQGVREEEPLDKEVYMYQMAIGQLNYCFAEDARALIKGYCFAFIAVAGPEFALAMKNLEPLALFVVMHFGVLLDRTANDLMAWWIASIGRDLVKEVSEILQQSSLAQISDVYEGISWTRQQVGLPALEEVTGVLSAGSILDMEELENKTEDQTPC